MPHRLVWDVISERVVESGIEMGVIRSKSGLMVPWNGLITVNESEDAAEIEDTYFDGRKLHHQKRRGFFACEITGYQLPSEFDDDHRILRQAMKEIIGERIVRWGLYLTAQEKRDFDFSYQTRVGDGAYKIHLVYDARIVQTTSGHTTLADGSAATVFAWKVVTNPPETFDLTQALDPYSSTSHLVVDSRTSDPAKLLTLEDQLYGTSMSYPDFPTQDEVLAIFA